MKVMVTGATGFIGANLVRALLEQGYQVKALVRRESTRKNIEGADIEVIIGDLRDRTSLGKALNGCEVLFHVAASYTFWSSDAKGIYETNVKGTENILAAAMAEGIERVVYTSTESTIGIAKNRKLGIEDMEIDPGTIARARASSGVAPVRAA